MNLKYQIANILKDIAKKLENDECELSESELLSLLSQIAHTSMNKTESAEFLGMSVRNFDRQIKNGILPAGKHNIGDKQLHWYKDELLTFKN